MPSTPKDSGGGMRSIRRVTLTGRHEGPSRQSVGSESGTRERAPRSIPDSGLAEPGQDVGDEDINRSPEQQDGGQCSAKDGDGFLGISHQ